MKLKDITQLGIVGFKQFKNLPSAEWVLPECRIGIEIEMESCPNSAELTRALKPFWSAVEDGSLRNYGLEVVSEPLFGEDLSISLDHLASSLEDNGIRPTFSHRTSVHIHMDVGDMTAEELTRLILLYIIFEPLLYNYVGEKRKHSIYAIPIYKLCYGFYYFSLYSAIIAAVKDKDYTSLAPLFVKTKKYTGLNLKPIVASNARARLDDENAHNDTGGHIEFRHHYGTKNPVEIKQWINILMSLKRAALSENTIKFDYDQLSRAAHNEYGMLVFKELWFIIGSLITEKELLESIRIAERLYMANNLHTPYILQKEFKYNKKLTPAIKSFYAEQIGRLYYATNPYDTEPARHFPQPGDIIGDIVITKAMVAEYKRYVAGPTYNIYKFDFFNYYGMPVKSMYAKDKIDYPTEVFGNLKPRLPTNEDMIENATWQQEFQDILEQGAARLGALNAAGTEQVPRNFVEPLRVPGAEDDIV